MDIMLGVVVAGCILALGVTVATIWRRERRRKIHERFGPEYDRALVETGSASKAERELRAREERVRRYPLRALTDEERARFTTDWHRVQESFVDRPGASVIEAHRLIENVMLARGYPKEDVAAQTADLSVHYPTLVAHYREACSVAGRHDRSEATTEELRQALVHYRVLFEALITERADAVRSPEATAASA